MTSRKYLTQISTWFALVLGLLTLSACKPSASLIETDKVPTVRKSKAKNRPKKTTPSTSSSTTSSSQTPPASQPTTSGSEKTAEGLPENAAVAPKDKIYATGTAKVYYEKFDGGFSSQTPDFTGYTPDLVKNILGAPDTILNDPQYLQTSFKEKELKNLKQLYQKQELTEEQARAFYLGAADIAQASQLGETYTLYSYQNETVFAIFEKDQLLYITPNPSVLSFK